MKPVSFPQNNRHLSAPEGMSEEECSVLPVWTDDEHCVSCWQLSWPERFMLLFRGKLWLWVWSGSTQPPVLVSAEDPWLLSNEEET